MCQHSGFLALAPISFAFQSCEGTYCESQIVFVRCACGGLQLCEVCHDLRRDIAGHHLGKKIYLSKITVVIRILLGFELEDATRVIVFFFRWLFIPCFSNAPAVRNTHIKLPLASTHETILRTILCTNNCKNMT